MPHIIVEYTNDLDQKIDMSLFLKSINEIVAKHYEGDLNRIKSRAIKFNDYYIGNHGSAGSMVNITLLLIEGKTDEVKHNMGKDIWDFACETYKPDNDQFQVSLEIRDISKKFYFK